MFLTTTFWSKEIHRFEYLFLIQGSTREIISRADLNDKWDSIKFFKDVSRFRKNQTIHDENDSRWYQFAVIENGKILPIKWFDLHISECVVISHDIAFETTLIKRNGIDLPFGKFPHWTKHPLPLNREFKLKSLASKYIANQIQKYGTISFNSRECPFSPG